MHVSGGALIRSNTGVELLTLQAIHPPRGESEGQMAGFAPFAATTSTKSSIFQRPFAGFARSTRSADEWVFLLRWGSPGSECVGTAAAVTSPKHRDIDGIARREGCRAEAAENNG